MASILDNQAIREIALPISVGQYHELVRSGIIGESTELLRGVIVEKMTKSPRHTWTVQQLNDWFGPRVQPGAYLRKEEPLTLRVSEPEPDIAIVEGCPDDYLNAHPRSAHFVIEVAITSENVDREKANDYADAGVAEFWLVLPEKNTVEVFTEPSSNGYRSHASYRSGDSIPLTSISQLTFPVDCCLRQ